MSTLGDGFAFGKKLSLQRTLVNGLVLLISLMHKQQLR